eukprot:CAMPEP_0178922490 /NCGR_PEP_ID=MMETSP0786-20121207/16184_1 /TAXON_ID=186022 /ORGANISM="Thalassionema frauenfeldii, Strain CCMP 1798" /LENGTH=104 /DNA_ID=CAMNT_0020596863 /DNA_START=66 /DNA_END=380 /DNA_ORIENTATION=-
MNQVKDDSTESTNDDTALSVSVKTVNIPQTSINLFTDIEQPIIEAKSEEEEKNDWSNENETPEQQRDEDQQISVDDLHSIVSDDSRPDETGKNTVEHVDEAPPR